MLTVQQMLRRSVVTAVALAGMAVASFGVQPVKGQSRDAFRSSVDLVTIQASVRDARGRVVHGLTPADFEIRDNGQVRPVLSLRADRGSPVSVAVLLDLSGSMRIGHKSAIAGRALESLLSQLRNGEDEAALFTFDSTLQERHAFTSDIGTLRSALSELTPFGTTSLYDATAATARHVAARSSTHRAIIVLTDGTDTSSTLTPPQVSGLASSIDVPVYIIVTVPPIDERLMKAAEAQMSESPAANLRELAEWTGGRVVYAGTPTDATIVASRLLEELRQQYVLAIEAANVREWRRLAIRVKGPSLIVRARSGYFGG
jgi:VWFA-related protein